MLATLLAGSATGPAVAAADEPAPVLVDRFEDEVPLGGPGTSAMDAAALYGKSAPALTASVVTDTTVRPVRNGGSADIGLSVATSGSLPTREPVTVTYATKRGTAEPGRDYTPVTGSHTFPAGTRSGTTHRITVRTAKASKPSGARTIPWR